MNSSESPVDILIVEDNPGDARLIKEILNEKRIYCRLHMVVDGIEAMNFLYRKKEFTKAPLPDLILLDLNLPKKDGREVLAEIKTNKSLKQIPVVIMTSSQAEDDILQSYQLHANCFITKPLELDLFIAAVKSIEEFWLFLARLPNKK